MMGNIKTKINNYLFKLWVYVLNHVQTYINNNIAESDELYAVYQPLLGDDIYICKSGKSALELYNQLNKVNMLLNRPQIKVIYGKVDHIFKYRLFKVMDIVFTWNVSGEESRKIYSYIADVPLR